MVIWEVGKPCPVPVSSLADGATALELWEDGLILFIQLSGATDDELAIYRDLRSYAYFESATQVPVAVWIFEFGGSSFADANFNARKVRQDVLRKFLDGQWNSLRVVLLDAEIVRSIRLVGLEPEAIRLFQETIRRQLAVQYTQRDYDRDLWTVYQKSSEELFALGRRFQHRPAPAPPAPVRNRRRLYGSLADRLRGHIARFEQRYPKIWREIDRLRMERGRSLPEWPDWCFVPVAVSMIAVLRYYRHVEQFSPEWLKSIADAGVLSALSAWRVTQGVYDFHPELFARLVETPLEGDLPVGLFEQMPEWCCYLSFADRRMEKMLEGCHGAFVHLEHDLNTGRRELRFLVDMDQEDGSPKFVPLVLHVGEGRSIHEAIAGFAATVFEQMERHREQSARDRMLMPGDAVTLTDTLTVMARPMVSLLLYLCSANAEIQHAKHSERRVGERPAAKRVKGGELRLFPPDNANLWRVGYRIGAAIERAREEARKGAVGGAAVSGRRSPIPHVRRAHWHTFWTGPRSDPDRRMPKVQWLPPIFVKGRQKEENEAIIPVIKPVR